MGASQRDEKLQSIRLIHTIHIKDIRGIFPAHFKVLMIKTRDKYYNKRSKTRDNDNVQSHDQRKSQLNSTIIAKSGVPTIVNAK